MFNKYFKKHLLVSLLLIVFMIITIVLIYQRYILNWTDWADWTGFGNYTGSLPKEDRGKTLWDVLDLIIIPLFLLVVPLILNKNKYDSDLDQHRETIMLSYVDRINELYFHKELTESIYFDEVNALARTITYSTFQLLDGNRKRLLLEYLYSLGLIKGVGKGKLSLRGLDLSDANLEGVCLAGANLYGVNLKNAILDNADLNNTEFQNANLKGASIKNVNIKCDNFFGAIFPDGKPCEKSKYVKEK